MKQYSDEAIQILKDCISYGQFDLRHGDYSDKNIPFYPYRNSLFFRHTGGKDEQAIVELTKDKLLYRKRNGTFALTKLGFEYLSEYLGQHVSMGIEERDLDFHRCMVERYLLAKGGSYDPYELAFVLQAKQTDIKSALKFLVHADVVVKLPDKMYMHRKWYDEELRQEWEVWKRNTGVCVRG